MSVPGGTMDLTGCNVLRSLVEADQSHKPSKDSIIDSLKSIQEENPQIETIFIESDEEEDKHTKRAPPMKLHSMKASAAQLNVKEISPNMLTTNLLSNGNTIVLLEESNIALPKKYLVIPKETYPLFAKSQGPISLNVPGVGPLVLSNPSEIIQPPPLEKIVYQKPETAAVYDPLSDQKYSCWRYRKSMKRDLEGYSLVDTLGFYKTEQKRSKFCIANCMGLIEQLQLSINTTKRKLANIQSSKPKIENIRLVEIDKIKKHTAEQPPHPVPTREISAKPDDSPVEISSEDEPEDGTNDLLLTKKVVVLNEMKRRGRKRKFPLEHDIRNRKVGWVDFDRNKNDDHTYNASEPSFLEHSLGIKRKRGRPRLFKIRESDVKIPVKRKRGRPRKIQRPQPPSPTESEVINSVIQFESEIDSSKPILIVNQTHCEQLDLAELSSVNNLVFPVAEKHRFSSSFIESAKNKEVKFVKPTILGNYFINNT